MAQDSQTILIVAALGVVGYFVYEKFFASSAVSAASAAGGSSSSSQSSSGGADYSSSSNGTSEVGGPAASSSSSSGSSAPADSSRPARTPLPAGVIPGRRLPGASFAPQDLFTSVPVGEAVTQSVPVQPLLVPPPRHRSTGIMGVY